MPQPIAAKRAKKDETALVPTAAPKRQIIGIKVKFELNSRNGLRRVIFGLEKLTEGDVVTWKINFQLLERGKRSEPFDAPIVSLDVEVDAALNKKAELAAEKGLTEGQGSHALGPAADDVKAFKAGEIEEAEAKDSVQGTLRKK